MIDATDVFYSADQPTPSAILIQGVKYKKKTTRKILITYTLLTTKPASVPDLCESLGGKLGGGGGKWKQRIQREKLE